MPSNAQANATVGDSYKRVDFLPGLPGGYPAIKMSGYDNVGIWYDPDTKAFKMRLEGVDVYTFDDSGGLSVSLGVIAAKAKGGLGGTTAPSIGWSDAGAANIGFDFDTNRNSPYLAYAGNKPVAFSSAGLGLQSGGGILWSSAANDSLGSFDLFLVRDAAGLIALRNAANAQGVHVYNTFTDTSNYERGRARWVSNVFILGSEKLGSGTSRDVALETDTVLHIRTTSATDRWTFNLSTGHLLPGGDRNYNIGAAGSNVLGLFYTRRCGLRNTITYSASMTPDCTLGEFAVITATNGTAFTINNPTNPVLDQILSIQIRNTFGALGVATFGAAYKMTAWVQPANGFSRTIEFKYDGTNWIEVDRSAADVPN